MKIHCQLYNDHEGVGRVWSMSKKEARFLALNEIEKVDGKRDSGMLMNLFEYDIPLTKKGIVKWMNSYFNRNPS